MQEAAAEAARAVPVSTSVAVSCTEGDLGDAAPTSSESIPATAQSSSPRRGLQQLYSAKEINEGSGKAATDNKVTQDTDPTFLSVYHFDAPNGSVSCTCWQAGTCYGQ